MTPTKLLIGQIILVLAIVVAGIWTATQWAAAALGYQPGLGVPSFHLLGTPVYEPWAIFIWWFAFDAYAPTVFDEAGAIAAAGGLVGCAVAIAGSIWRARQSRHVTTYGSARWATLRDIAAAGLLDDHGVALGKTGRRYLRHDGPEHVMAFAPTRSGKGVGLVVPTLLSWTGSAVVHDIKGENWELTAGWRSLFSHCLLFNPTDARSARYNPLLDVRRGTNEVRDVQNIADILVDPEGALERRGHWERTSHSLLVGAILHVLYAEGEKTLAKVATVLSDPQRTFEQVLRHMMSTNHLGTQDAPQVHPVVASAARELLNKSDNERSGVLSTAMSFLALYRDPTIAAVTSASDWRIADLVEAAHPVTLYLVVPPSDISRTKPLVRLILNQLGRRLTERLHTALPSPDTTPRQRVLRAMLNKLAGIQCVRQALDWLDIKYAAPLERKATCGGTASGRPPLLLRLDTFARKLRICGLLSILGIKAPVASSDALARQDSPPQRHRLLLMLDEFPALGRLDFFETSLAFLAGYGVRVFLIAQSLNQIEKAYGEHNAILDNCHVRVAFATNDERTAKRISDALGTATEQRSMRNYAGHRLAPWLAHVMVSRQETARALLTPGEVMQLPASDELVLVAGAPPIRTRKLRYYEDQSFTARVLPAPELSEKIYADRPAQRANAWSDQAAVADERLVVADNGQAKPDDGGRDHERHPAQEPIKAPTPEATVSDPLGLAEDDGDGAAERRAMDRAQDAGPARAVYAMDAGSDRAGDFEMDL